MGQWDVLGLAPLGFPPFPLWHGAGVMESRPCSAKIAPGCGSANHVSPHLPRGDPGRVRNPKLDPLCISSPASSAPHGLWRGPARPVQPLSRVCWERAPAGMD